MIASESTFTYCGAAAETLANTTAQKCTRGIVRCRVPCTDYGGDGLGAGVWDSGGIKRMRTVSMGILSEIARHRLKENRIRAQNCIWERNQNNNNNNAQSRSQRKIPLARDLSHNAKLHFFSLSLSYSPYSSALDIARAMRFLESCQRA